MRKWCRFIGSALVATAALGVASSAFARRNLEAVTLGTSKVRVDGLLREWPAKLDTLTDVVSGSPATGDPNASGVVGYDDKNLYVVFKIRDKKLLRTSSFGEDEDYAALDLAFPVGGKT